MPKNYLTLLEQASDKIWRYQAARTALSNCYKYFQALEISFGKKRGKENYPFPESFTDAAIRPESKIYLGRQIRPESKIYLGRLFIHYWPF